MSKLKNFLCLGFAALTLAVFFVLGSSVLTHAQSLVDSNTSSRDELEAIIKARAEQLEKINKELESTQQNLFETKTQKSNLQADLNRLTKNISQLELNIKADEITTQKLSYEIENIGYDIRSAELSIDEKKKAIARIMREIQAQDNLNPFIVFLRSSSLADAVFGAHTLNDLQTQLRQDIATLTNLQNGLGEKLKSVGDRKGQIESSKRNLETRKNLIEDQKEERKVILTQTKNKESIYAQQLNDLKKQQDAIEDEIAKYENELRKKFDTGLAPKPQKGLFEWPIALVSDGGAGRITQHFGEKSNLYRGKPHNGLDIGAVVGTPIVAADEGTVVAVDNNDRSLWSKYQYGKYVLIRHPNNVATLYAHLSKQSVSVGQKVARGELVGYSGNTGYSTGPHLHLGAYWAPSIELKSVPPAAGRVPVGVLLDIEDYL